MIRQRLLILCQTNSKELKSKKDNLNFFWDKEPVSPSGIGPSPTSSSSDHGAGSSGKRWVTSNSTRWHIGHLVLMYCFMPLSSHSCPNCPSENMSDRLNWHSAQAEWSRQQWDWRFVPNAVKRLCTSPDVLLRWELLLVYRPALPDASCRVPAWWKEASDKEMARERQTVQKAWASCRWGRTNVGSYIFSNMKLSETD